MSLRDKILSVEDIQKEQVYVEAWGVTVEVRSMTGIQRAKALNGAMDGKGNIQHEKLHPELLVACLYDPETGERLFTDADKDALMNKNATAIEQLISKAMSVSGLGQKEMERIEKNSDSDTPSEDSTSD